VIFDSAASLWTMISKGQADLGGNFDISVVGWDGVLSFRGYSVCIIPGVDNSVRLVKNE
jgi:hypothetical protein